LAFVDDQHTGPALCKQETGGKTGGGAGGVIVQAEAGRQMIAGYVLYLGEQTLPFGEGLRALPLGAA
jgi:hypothetical protein